MSLLELYLDDHKPLPGITIGDIGMCVPYWYILCSINLFSGPKACDGQSANDNGFACFDRVRIPKENMLSGFAQVTSEGEYVQPPHAKLSYGGVSTCPLVMSSLTYYDDARCFTSVQSNF